MRSIGFLTFHTLDYNCAYYAEMTCANKANYCERHGYTFYNYNTFEEKFSVEWSKIIYCLKLLQKHDWLFWSDADAMITNLTIKLEDFLDDSVNAITSKDINGMNTGHFFLKNSEWSMLFLKELYNLRVRFENKDPEIKANQHGQFTDQDAMIYLWDKNWNNTRSNFKFVDKKLINSYYFNGDTNDWTPGDFVLHLPATLDRANKFNSIRKHIVY